MHRAALASLLVCALASCGDNRTFTGPSPYAPGTEPTFECLPNLDGVLESGELPLALDRPLTLIVGESRDVDLEGEVDAAGRRTWSLGTDFADDRLEQLTATRLSDQWFSAEFVGADFVLPLDFDGQVLSVYHQDQRALYLHGVASAEPDPPEGRTLLRYDTPIALFEFPLEVGRRWTSVGTVSEGTALGLPYRGTDTYEVEVQGAGRLDLPDWSFSQAYRVDQQITVAPAIGDPIQRRITSWLFECFGEVARAESETGVDGPFTRARQLRRITPR